MTRSDRERFADLLNAIDRCQNYEQYLRSDEFGWMAFVHQLGPLAQRLRNL